MFRHKKNRWMMIFHDDDADGNDGDAFGNGGTRWMRKEVTHEDCVNDESNELQDQICNNF